MKEFYIKLREAEKKLSKNGYYLDNMVNFDNEYEIYNVDDKVVIDHLSIAQVIQLSNMF